VQHLEDRQAAMRSSRSSPRRFSAQIKVVSTRAPLASIVLISRDRPRY